ncbi:MAG: multicopper oxidase domain-containing protein [bacterium]|nr:multicopper oxidase domain-containing protein [bacterium]
MTRRQFVKIGLLSGAAMSSSNVFRRHVEAAGKNAHPDFLPDVELRLQTTHTQVPIFATGNVTDVWSYQGEILKGEAHNLTAIPESYLGPIIRVKKGQKIRIYFDNELPESSVIHWHGLHVPEKADGHPRLAISQGERYVYEFEVNNRAGTYWYHPHPHRRTGRQVYFGLAGLFLVEDEEEAALALPAGEFEIPLVIQDRRFTNGGALSYIQQGMRGHMDWMQGFLGDTILVNGKPDAVIAVKTAQYRIRLLNGSNSRIYKLYLDSGQDFRVIGTDGGLLDAPQIRPYLTLAPAERIDLLLDFSQMPADSNVALRSMPFDGGGMEGMMGNRGPRNGGGDFKIADFHVSSGAQGRIQLPERLSAIEAPDIHQAINASNPRLFQFQMHMMNVAINGRRFEMNDVAPEEEVRLNTTEVWELVNAGPMSMPHPAHIHGLQFRILERRGSSPELYEGYVDSGWKDTLLLMPGERARILLRFEDFNGLYMYHCHNLEHEDLGMMRNYRVSDSPHVV